MGSWQDLAGPADEGKLRKWGECSALCCFDRSFVCSIIIYKSLQDHYSYNRIVDPDFSCGSSHVRTKVFQEVLADLENCPLWKVRPSHTL